MAKAFRVNLSIDQGSDFDRTFTLKNGPAESRTPVDLTGYTARMQVRQDIDDEDPLLELTTENGGIVLGDAAGTIQLVLTATQTAGLDFDSAVYDLELVSGAGRVRRLMRGVVTLSREVTR